MDWLNPLNAIELQKAVKARKKSVVLKLQEDKPMVPFIITYETGDRIFIKPAFDLVPCGWLSIERVMLDSFLERQGG